MGILTRFRSARTGQYTTGAEANANEDTTVRETAPGWCSIPVGDALAECLDLHGRDETIRRLKA